MADSILPQGGAVPFLTGADAYLLPAEPPPSLAILPEASAETLWRIAESRLQQLETLLNILSCSGETEIVVPVSEVADLIRAQVQGVLMLAKEGNQLIQQQRVAA
jgi:hypothetical protein